MPKTTQLYETRPLESWGRAKELRRQHFKHIWQHRPLIVGLHECLQALPAGLGEFADFGYGAYLRTIMKDRKLMVGLFEKSESVGYGRDVCDQMRIHLGGLFADYETRAPSGEPVQPDFALQVNLCTSQTKTGQIFAERYGIPYFTLDLAHIGSPNRFEYLVSQMHDCIEWMEQVTGRTYDDEKLIEAAANEWRSGVLWARVCALNKAVPAPVGARQLHALLIPVTNAKSRRETVSYLEMLYEEVQQRVRDGIAGLSTERYRLHFLGIVPWYYPQVLRVCEPYGAAIVSAQVAFGHGAFRVAESGHWDVASTPEERGVPLKTRDDALRALADLYLYNSPLLRNYEFPGKATEAVAVARDWGAQGVVMHQNRGCHAMTASFPEVRVELQKQGFSVVAFEASQADIREFDQNRVVGALESFLESQGLARLREPGAAREEPDD